MRAGAGYRILIVDDDPAIYALGSSVLERAGYSCEGAADAAEARSALSEGIFDLILCDVRMPGESGLTLIRDVAASHPDTAIVMVTGVDDPDMAEAALKVGAFGYIVKPVERTELLIAVSNALRRLALEQENRANWLQLEGALADRSTALEQERTLRKEGERQVRENQRLMESLRERQTLLERLSKIQRSISHRAELTEILDAIVGGAHELLGEEIVALFTIDQDDPSSIAIAASRGVTRDELATARRAAVGEGVGGDAITTAGLVVVDDESPAPTPAQALTGVDTSAAMGAPVREETELVGSLVVGSRTPGRTYTIAEREALTAFADHASLALTDARMLSQMHDALHDSLTGLPNRNMLVERLETAGDDTQAGDPDHAVLLIDIDRFGNVNETLGHAAGDLVLVEIARRLKDCIHATDTAARFGADDFAILVNDAVGRADPDGMAERVQAALAPPIAVRGREIALTASIGIAVGRDGAHELLQQADIAMSRARRQGRGRYARFSAGMREGLLQHLELEADLQRAVEREEFEVHYQPIIALSGQQLAGFEALVRWQHPERGLVPPLAFIPLAEEMGLIDAIGRIVLRRACEQAARWQSQHPTDPPLSVNVNLSARQLQRPDFPQQVAEILREFSIEPRRLVLEITESILMDDTECAERALPQLKALGVRLAIDDFGTGYSSLHYVRRFPLDILKVAKPFVDGLARTPEETALVRTILDLADNFRLEVVAEGIETLRQYVELRRLGCGLGQGFHFCHPLDQESTALLITRAASGYGRLGKSSSQDFRLPPLVARSQAVRAAGLSRA